MLNLFALKTETNSPYIACKKVIIYKRVVQHRQIEVSLGKCPPQYI